MLQDLDARARTDGEAVSMVAKPVARRARRRMLLPALLAIIGVAVVTAGALGWRHWRAAPAARSLPVQVRMAAVPAPPVAPPAPASVAQAVPAPEAPSAEVAAAGATPGAPAAHPRAASSRALAPRARGGEAAGQREHAPAAPAAGGVSLADAGPQAAERSYRRALEQLREGDITNAVAGLERALASNPRHEGARQTLVGLLLEAGRTEDAMRQLESGLSAESGQPALAMLLARLRLERGGDALAPLQAALPAAANNSEFHAFLAGILQRQGRNAEAAQHYEVALRVAPNNAVWWMGLGIALQGDQRGPAALDAFRRARALGLSAELQAFVDRQISQLSR